MSVLVKTGEVHNFLVFTWITVFFFNLAIPIGKVAVAAFLIEMNAQGSTYFDQLNQATSITSCLQISTSAAA